MKTHHFSASVVAISLLASSVVTAQPDSVVNVVPASRNRDPGSIAALLDHISAQGRKALPINMIPDELKSKPTPADNATPVIRNPKNVNLEGALNIQARDVEPSAEERRAFLEGMSGRMVKKWVWGNSILQDDPLSTGVPGPPLASNVNGFTNGAIVNPPAPTMIAPSFPPLAKPSVFSSAPAVLPSPVVTPAPTLASAKTRARVLPSTRANIVGRADSGCTKVYITDNQRQIAENERKEKDEKEKKDKEEKDKKDKRWIWATSILQDDGFVPPAGQPTIGGINSPGAENTPNANLVAPTFPPLPLPTPMAPMQPVVAPPIPVVSPLPDNNIAVAAPVAPVNPKATSTQAAIFPVVTDDGRIKFANGTVARIIPNPKKLSTALPTAPIKVVIPVVPHPGAPIWTKTVSVQPGISATVFGVTPTTAPAPVQGILPRHAGSDPRRVDHQRMIKRKDVSRSN